MKLIRRVISGLLLVAYAAVGTSVLPAAMTLLAALDGSHAMSVQMSNDGMQLTLRHRAQDFTPCVQDHPGSLGRVVTSLCRTVNSGDHRLTAGHISTTVTVERDQFKTQETPAVLRNSEASFLLSLLTAFDSSSGDFVRNAIASTDAYAMHQRPMMATVQLLL